MLFVNLKNLVLLVFWLLAVAGCQSRAVITGNIDFSSPSFSGINAVGKNNNGTFTVSWIAAKNAQDVSYQIFAREVPPLSLIEGFYNLFTSNTDNYFTTPTATVTNTTEWISNLLTFKNNNCFIVRAIAKKLTDTNIVELCTNHIKYAFAGLNGVTANSDNTFTLDWSAVPHTPVTYNIYQRTETGGVYNFETPIVADSTTVGWTSGVLSAQASQCFVVRAKSASQIFTDSNSNEICTNHTQMTFAEINNLSATATNNNTVVLTWIPNYASSGGYKVSYTQGAIAPTTCASETVLAADNILGTSAIINNLVANTQYSARVCAVNNDAAATTSIGSVLSFTTSNVIITEPTSVGAAATNSSTINITWSYTGSDTPNFKISYAIGTAAPILCTTGTVVNSSQITATGALVTGLDAATTYSFKICTVNANNIHSAGVNTSATTMQGGLAAPPNVSALNAIVINSSNILLSWTTGGGSTAAFKVSYTLGATAPASCILGTILASNNINQSTALISGLSDETQYSFRVCAVNSNATPDVSSGTTISATTLEAAAPNPTALGALALSDSIINLSWTSGGSNTAGYAVSYQHGATAPAYCDAGTLLAPGQISGTTASITGLSSNTQYSFRVCAKNGNTPPVLSGGTTVTATSLHSAPPNVSNVSAAAGSDTTIFLTWTSGYLSTSGYKVSYASGASAPASCAAAIVLPQGQISGTNATVTGLTADTQYSFRICAINANTTPDVSSGTTASGTTIKAAPGNLSGTSGANLITLSWSTIVGATNYAIYYSTSASVNKATATKTIATAPSYQVTSLSVNTTYYFNIAVIINNVESDLSASETSAITYPAPPAAPTNVYLSWPYYKGMQLHFGTVAGAVNYKLYYKTSPGVSASDTAVNGIVDGQILGSLNGQGTYYAKISALDAYAQETLSSEVSLTMPEYIAAPLNLSSYNKIASFYSLSLFASGGTIYAATSNGLSISTDTGSTWINKSTANGLGHNEVGDIFVSGNTIYAATIKGLSISTDTGFTWLTKTTVNGLGNNITTGVYVIGSNIYVATQSGLSISTNSGASFVNKTTAQGLADNAPSKVYATGSNIYASSFSGLSISTDAGSTWIFKNSATGLPDDTVSGIYATGSSIYVGTGMGLSISTNSGSTWATKTTADGLGSDWIVDVYANGGSLYVGTDVGLSVSTDSGATWANPYTTGYVNRIQTNGSNIYLSIDSGGVNISTNNGFTWAGKSTTNRVTNITNGVYVSGTNVFVANGLGVSIFSTDFSTWSNKTSSSGLGVGAVYSFYADGSTIYAATASGVSISTNAGVAWLNKNSGLANVITRKIYASGVNIYAATEGGLAISTNSGTGFANKTTATGLGANTIRDLYVSGGTIYAATTGGLSISTDSGLSFTNKTTATGLGSNFIYGFSVSGSTIYAATDAGLAISTDSGTTFINKTTTSGLGSNTVYQVYLSGGTIYASTYKGLSVSTDGGITFTNKNTLNGLGGDSVNSVHISGSTIYVSTERGLAVSGL